VLARVGSSWFAVPAARVLRVTRAVTPHRIPHRTHRALRGLANIDGEVAIVMDLASLCGFGWSPSGTAAARMIVVGERGARHGVPVHEPLAAVDEPLVEESQERRAHRGRAHAPRIRSDAEVHA